MLTALSLFRTIAILLLIFFSSSIFPAEKIKVDFNAEADFLPYKYYVLTSKQAPSHLPQISQQNQIISEYRKPGDTAIFLHVYNPSALSDQPAIFSYQNFTENKVIDDNPIKMTINDSEFYIDSTDHIKRTIAVGYHHDTAYVVQNKYLEDRFDKKLLYVGQDGTGDGRWIPQLEVVLISDYDFDGHQEAFVYLNSIREKTPRILYCLDLPSLEMEWQLEVSPLISRGYVYNAQDSANPAVWFVAYNPKQGASDQNFKDLYAYLAKVNSKGEIVFQKIISNEYAHISMIKNDDSLYYIIHSLPFNDPSDTLSFPEPKYKISAFNNQGEIIYQTDCDGSVGQLWFADYDQDGTDEIYALSAIRSICIFNRKLELIAFTEKTNIGSFATKTRLPYYAQEVLVFTSKQGQQDLYSPQLRKLAVVVPVFRFYEPFVYDENGQVITSLAHGGGNTYFIHFEQNTYWEFVKIAFWKYENYILALFFILFAIILFINQSRLKSLRKYREAEGQYHALLSNIPVGVYRSSINGEALLANDAMVKMYGFESCEDYKNREVFKAYISKDDRSRFIDKLIKEGAISNQEFKVKRKDGSIMWVSTSAYAKFNDKGEMLYFDGIDVDITERKQAEIALLESEARFKGIVEEALVGIFLIEDYKLKYSNAEMENITGYSLEESYDTDPMTYVHPDDRMQAKTHLREIMEGDVATHSISLRFLTKLNNTKIVDIYASNISIQGKAVVVGTVLDVTEKRQAEDALAYSEEFNRTVLANSPLGISVRSKTGQLLSVNKAWMDIWRHTQEEVDELISRPRDGLKFDDTDNYLGDWVPKVREIYEKGGYLHVPEVPLLKYKNRDRWVSQYFYAIKNDNGEVERVVVLTEDITSRKHAETEVRTSQAQLKSIIESTNDYIALCDRDGNALYYNSAFANIVTEVFGMPVEDLKFPPYGPDHPDYSSYTDIFKRVLAGEQHSIDVKRILPDGTELYLKHSYNPVFEGDEVIGFSEFTHNITDLKEYAFSLEKNYKYQTLLNDLLEIALERLPLTQHLNKFLKALTGASFLPLKSQGAIFMSDEDGHLTLKSALNLPESLHTSCAEIFPGQCLCGKVAQSKEFIYKPGVDHEHVINYEDMTSHGHYCVPILSENELLGVINLYLEVDHKYDQHEQDFLTAAAKTLAGVIERQKIEERLHLMLSAVEQSKEGLAIVDLDGNIKFINQAFAQMHGYQPDELFGKNLAIFHNENQIEEVLAANNQMKTTGDFIGEIWHTHRDGSVFPSMMHSSLLLDEANNPIGMIGTMRDISDLKKSEMALKESEQKFRSLAELTSTGIFIYKENQLVYANPMAKEITGYTIEELNKITIWGTVAPEYKEMAIERGKARLRGDEVETTYEMEIICKSGDRKWILYTGTQTEYEGEPAILGTFFDITESKKNAERIKQIERERYNQTKEIAGGVAHEIYNSLFPATSTLDKLKQRLELTEKDEIVRNKKLVDLAETAIWRALSMTETVTQFSRLDSVRDIEIIILKEFVKEFVKELLNDNSEYLLQNIQFKLNVDPSATLKINRNHLFSIFNSIIGNAIDAMSENREKIIEITIKSHDKLVEISIKDNGPGIPPDIIEKVFDPFFSTKPRTGTGLGLAICKKIIDIYDGQLTLDSVLDEGSKFVILLKAP